MQYLSSIEQEGITLSNIHHSEVSHTTQRSDRRKTRKEKADNGTKRVVKEKFTHEHSLAPIVAKTEKQKKYLAMLNDPDVQVIVCQGHFGVGKSYLSAIVAAEQYRKNLIQKIIVARPHVQTGKSSGLKPGTVLEKQYPYLRNVLDTIKQRLGAAAFEIALKDGEHGDIQVQELENIRGRSFDEPSFLLIEEAQQSTPEEMLAILTRIGDNCKLVVSGDLNQRDIKGDSGLKWLVDFVERHKIEGVGMINFDSVDDIVRSGLLKKVAIGLMKDGAIPNTLTRRQSK